MPAPSAPYTPFYPSWQDNAGGGTPIDAAALNHMEAGIEAALPAPASPASGDVPIWNPAANGGAGGWDTTTNLKIQRAALGSLAIKDADVDPAAALSISKLNGFPNSATKFVRGDGVWAAASQAPFRKTTAKTVVNTVAETDLLNGEITIPGNLLGTNGYLRLTAEGDSINNTGATQTTPRFKLKLGATTIIDTSTLATMWGTSVGRFPWKIVVEILNKGAANSQWTNFQMDMIAGAAAATTGGTVTTGDGTLIVITIGSLGKYLVEASSAGLTAIDTTVAQVLALTVTNPVASASLDVTLQSALVEIL